MIDTNKIKYMYVGDRSKAHTNVATVAYIVEEDKLLVGVSYSNNEDIYDKEYGKSLAVERLLVERNPVVITPVGSVARTILDYLQAKPLRQPSWVKRKVVKHKINYFVDHETTRTIWNEALFRESIGTKFFNAIFGK